MEYERVTAFLQHFPIILGSGCTKRESDHHYYSYALIRNEWYGTADFGGLFPCD
jgi:hypothetical protein